MSFAALQTPQRPLPGAFMQTPAASRYPSGQDLTRRQLFHNNSESRPQDSYNTNGATSGGQQLQQQPQPQQQHQQQQQQQQQQPQQQQNNNASQAQNPTPTLLPVQRAARTVNEALQRDASYPDLDTYVRQGISSDYYVPGSTTDRAWAPFEKGQKYDMPDSIYEQINNSQLAIMMGLFAELNHAWVAIDNSLYLWDYTQVNPELVGYEEQPNSITAVKLMIPRAGVFVPSITHILVVATTAEIQILGLSTAQGSGGAKTVTLYATGMSQSIRGINVNVIEGSNASGRIFFAGSGDNDVYELTYQQEEKWFSSRCAKINHTSPGIANFIPPPFWHVKKVESVKSMVIDDTRNLLYTLSSDSSIRAFHLETLTTLTSCVNKSRDDILRDISHMTSQTPLLSKNVGIVSINVISAREASKLHLMAVTSTGCRLFLSATRGYGYAAGKGEAPTSMQVQHIKFPPKEVQAPQSSGSNQSQTLAVHGADQPIDTQSQALQYTREGFRFPPGMFVCFLNRGSQTRNEVLFLSAPDSGHIALQAREPQGARFSETGLWMSLEGTVEDIGLATRPFGATATPQGFGNELAVQFDQPAQELAILTNSGVLTLRRRRLMDVFAAAIRYGGSEEGAAGEMKRLIVQYGRGEAEAAALAVACGQGENISSTDSRVVKVTDPATLDAARKAFVEHGGKPRINENAVSDGSTQAIDHVIPSSRHEGLAIYIARTVRSLWKAPVIRQAILPGGATSIGSTIPTTKLLLVQEDLAKLDSFLEKNSTFIEGLSGPGDLQRASSRQEEIALQGEHQALHSLQVLTKSIVEGISFVNMLFDERVEDLWTSLEDTIRQRLRDLTYETLFASSSGKELGKTLVKAIVNRNIANGSNVDTVADALRRKCKSFCSAEDVLIFKAQEQLKRASELGANTDLGRQVLNESLRLFNQIAGSLSPDNLTSTVKQYIELQFYAGAIKLALNVAHEVDRGNRALTWVNDGKPTNDSRAQLYEERKRCYILIQDILHTVDAVSAEQPETVDGRYTTGAIKRKEAYAVVNDSEDELFQFDLYDWYLERGWDDRILAADSKYVELWLQRLASSTVGHADLLWRFYAHKDRFYEAASVQLQLAKSDFDLSLKARVEYLSRAKANASTQTGGIGRQARQLLLHEVTGLLDIANIQDDIMQRLKSDVRVESPEWKTQLMSQLNGPILGLTELYNTYADSASYYDIALLIYQAADHRNPADVAATWLNLIDFEHTAVVASDGSMSQQPYEHIISVVTELGHRLSLSEIFFPPNIVIPLLERYKHEHQRDVGPSTWIIDLLSNVGMPYENILPVLETMFYNDEAPFHGRNRKIIGNEMVYTIKKWLEHCIRCNQRLFGDDDNAASISNILLMLTQNGLDQDRIDQANDLRSRITRVLRG